MAASLFGSRFCRFGQCRREPRSCRINIRMRTAAGNDWRRLTGREPERFSLKDWEAAAGKWAAFELYTPETLPLRRIRAIGETVEDCLRHLAEQGLDARKFEITQLRAPL